MAEIVLGVGSSHSPMLGTDPEHWRLRAKEDVKWPAHPFRGKTYKFEELIRVRKRESLAEQLTMDVWRERHERNQKNLDFLASKIADADLDILVVIGDDQREVFFSDNSPSFLVYNGAKVLNKKASKNQLEAMPRGVSIAQWMNEPKEGDLEHRGAPDLANHIVKSVMEDGFDVSVADSMPMGRFGRPGIPHAFGFFYHRLLDDFRKTPNMATLPIFMNTFFPPNQPSAKRALAFGKAIGRAVRSWPGNARVGFAASGGFSHFVIDEDLDRRIMGAMEAGDEQTVVAEPESSYQSGTSEIKNWIAVMGAVAGGGLQFRIVDYVPCYRSLAGTGNANTFGLWH